MAQTPTPWTIEEYVTPNGKKPVLTFVEGLEREHKKAAMGLVKLLQEYGNTLGGPQSKALGDGLFELREGQLRLFYIFRRGRRAMLLDGMIKKQDAIPAKMLKRLRAMQHAVEAADRKAAGET